RERVRERERERKWECKNAGKQPAPSPASAPVNTPPPFSHNQSVETGLNHYQHHDLSEPTRRLAPLRVVPAHAARADARVERRASRRARVARHHLSARR